MDCLTFIYPARPKHMFKLSQTLKAFQTSSSPKRKLTIKQYECKKPSKYPLQQKIYDLIIIEDLDIVFFELCEKRTHLNVRLQKFSIFYCRQGFFESNFAFSLFGERKLKSISEYQVTTINVPGFVVEFISLNQSYALLLITNELILPEFKQLNKQQILHKFLNGFEEFISKTMTISKLQEYLSDVTNNLMERYISKEKHKEIISIEETNLYYSENRKKQKRFKINFQIVKYAQISYYSRMIQQQSIKQNVFGKQQSNVDNKNTKENLSFMDIEKEQLG